MDASASNDVHVHLAVSVLVALTSSSRVSLKLYAFIDGKSGVQLSLGLQSNSPFAWRTTRWTRSDCSRIDVTIRTVIPTPSRDVWWQGSITTHIQITNVRASIQVQASKEDSHSKIEWQRLFNATSSQARDFDANAIRDDTED